MHLLDVLDFPCPVHRMNTDDCWNSGSMLVVHLSTAHQPQYAEAEVAMCLDLGHRDYTTGLLCPQTERGYLHRDRSMAL